MAGKIDRLDIVGRNDMKWSYSKSTNEYKEREREAMRSRYSRYVVIIYWYTDSDDFWYICIYNIYILYNYICIYILYIVKKLLYQIAGYPFFRAGIQASTTTSRSWPPQNWRFETRKVDLSSIWSSLPWGIPWVKNPLTINKMHMDFMNH